MPAIRLASVADAPAIAGIYNHYVLRTTVTFEETALPDREMAGRIEEVRQAGLPYLVAESTDGILGYAFASKWKGRCAYRYSVEVSVYLRDGAGGRGVGSALYSELLPSLEAQGMHALIGGIALPNDASVRLHEKFGFLPVARFREVGFKFDRWVDVGYWQLVFEPGRAR